MPCSVDVIVFAIDFWIGALAIVLGRAASCQVSCVYPCCLSVHSTTHKIIFWCVAAVHLRPR